MENSGVQTGFRPGSDRVQTGFKSGSDRVQTGFRPGSDRVQTGFRCPHDFDDVDQPAPVQHEYGMPKLPALTSASPPTLFVVEVSSRSLTPWTVENNICNGPHNAGSLHSISLLDL